MKLIGILMLAISLGIQGPAWALTAEAEIHGTQPDSKISGTVTFEETPQGILVKGKFSGMDPGIHAFHIHENGSCDQAGEAAGSHYNPLGAKHGFLPKDGLEQAHVGDLGNIEIGPTGDGELDYTAFPIPSITIRGGKYDIERRTVIFHERPDDLSQPAGNAGGRIACGIILAKE